MHTTPGVGGGDQLGAGTRLPPLLLEDDEAIATAVCLRLASGGTVDLEWPALHVVRLGVQAQVLEPPELREAAARLAGRLQGLASAG